MFLCYAQYWRTKRKKVNSGLAGYLPIGAGEEDKVAVSLYLMIIETEKTRRLRGELDRAAHTWGSEWPFPRVMRTTVFLILRSVSTEYAFQIVKSTICFWLPDHRQGGASSTLIIPASRLDVP